MEVATVKNKNILSFLLLFILLLSFIPTAVFADDNLTITRWIVDSEVLNNGDLLVSEDITFDFKNKFNGVFRDIVTDNTDGIENIELYEMVKGKEVPYSLVKNAEKGDSQVFETNIQDNSTNLMIFSPSKNEEKTFRIKYTVKNVAVKYKDTGELYYKFIGQNNSTPVDYFSATIRLPEKVNDKVKIFAHGPLNGEINFINDSVIKLEVENVSANTFVEARILFPETFIPASTKIVSSNAYNNIMNEELSFIESIKEKEAKKSARADLFNNISLAIATLVVIFTVFTFRKLRRNVDMYDKINSLYPKEITPAEVGRLTNESIDNCFMATLFDLTRKGFMTIEENGEMKKNVTNFKFSRTIRPIKDLMSHETFFIEWIFNIVGDDNTFTTKDFKKHIEKSLTSYSKSINKWTQCIKKDLDSRGYYDKRAPRFGTFMIFISLISLIISIISLAFGGFYGFLLLAISIMTFIYSFVLFFRKSDEGQIEYKKWMDFKKDLTKQGKTISDFNTSMTIDEALTYGMALGINRSSLEFFKPMNHQGYNPTYFAYWYFMSDSKGRSIFENTYKKSFSLPGSTTTSSSSIGGGGGFSGGGGGGAGGGGAGGF